jgi:uric acid transporter
VDLTDNGNLVTVAVSVAFGVIPSAVPELYDRGSHKVSG